MTINHTCCTCGETGFCRACDGWVDEAWDNMILRREQDAEQLMEMRKDGHFE